MESNWSHNNQQKQIKPISTKILNRNKDSLVSLQIDSNVLSKRSLRSSHYDSSKYMPRNQQTTCRNKFIGTIKPWNFDTSDESNQNLTKQTKNSEKAQDKNLLKRCPELEEKKCHENENPNKFKNLQTTSRSDSILLSSTSNFNESSEKEHQRLHTESNEKFTSKASLLDWLETELDQRGIDSVIYGKHLFSILQQNSVTNQNYLENFFDCNDLDVNYGSITSDKLNQQRQGKQNDQARNIIRYCESHQKLYPNWQYSSNCQNKFSIKKFRDNTQKPPTTTKWMHKRYLQHQQPQQTLRSIFKTENEDEMGNLFHNLDADTYFDQFCPDCTDKKDKKEYRKIMLMKCLKSAFDKNSSHDSICKFIDEICQNYDQVFSDNNLIDFNLNHYAGSIENNQEQFNSAKKSTHYSLHEVDQNDMRKHKNYFEGLKQNDFQNERNDSHNRNYYEESKFLDQAKKYYDAFPALNPSPSKGNRRQPSLNSANKMCDNRNSNEPSDTDSVISTSKLSSQDDLYLFSEEQSDWNGRKIIKRIIENTQCSNNEATVGSSESFENSILLDGNKSQINRFKNNLVNDKKKKHRTMGMIKSASNFSSKEPSSTIIGSKNELITLKKISLNFNSKTNGNKEMNSTGTKKFNSFESVATTATLSAKEMEKINQIMPSFLNPKTKDLKTNNLMIYEIASDSNKEFQSSADTLEKHMPIKRETDQLEKASSDEKIEIDSINCLEGRNNPWKENQFKNSAVFDLLPNFLKETIRSNQQTDLMSSTGGKEKEQENLNHSNLTFFSLQQNNAGQIPLYNAIDSWIDQYNKNHWEKIIDVLFNLKDTNKKDLNLSNLWPSYSSLENNQKEQYCNLFQKVIPSNCNEDSTCKSYSYEMDYLTKIWNETNTLGYMEKFFLLDEQNKAMHQEVESILNFIKHHATIDLKLSSAIIDESNSFAFNSNTELHDSNFENESINFEELMNNVLQSASNETTNNDELNNHQQYENMKLFTNFLYLKKLSEESRETFDKLTKDEIKHEDKPFSKRYKLKIKTTDKDLFKNVDYVNGHIVHAEYDLNSLCYLNQWTASYEDINCEPNCFDYYYDNNQNSQFEHHFGDDALLESYGNDLYNLDGYLINIPKPSTSQTNEFDQLNTEIESQLSSAKISTTNFYDSINLKLKLENRFLVTDNDTKPVQKPCAFYLENACARVDCKYSHDLSSIPCKYYQEGACYKEEFCPFLHDEPKSELLEPFKVPSSSALSKLDPNAESFQFKIESDSDFPSLFGTPTSENLKNNEKRNRVDFIKMSKNIIENRNNSEASVNQKINDDANQIKLVDYQFESQSLNSTAIQNFAKCFGVTKQKQETVKKRNEPCKLENQEEWPSLTCNVDGQLDVASKSTKIKTKTMKQGTNYKKGKKEAFNQVSLCQVIDQNSKDLYTNNLSCEKLKKK